MRSRSDIQAGLPRIRSTGEALSPESAIALLIQAQVEISLDIREQNQRIIHLLESPLRATAETALRQSQLVCICRHEAYSGRICPVHT